MFFVCKDSKLYPKTFDSMYFFVIIHTFRQK